MAGEVESGEVDKFYFLFGKKDHWVADETRDGFIEKRKGHVDGKVRVAVDEGGVPHAFCIREWFLGLISLVVDLFSHNLAMVCHPGKQHPQLAYIEIVKDDYVPPMAQKLPQQRPPVIQPPFQQHQQQAFPQQAFPHHSTAAPNTQGTTMLDRVCIRNSNNATTAA